MQKRAGLLRGLVAFDWRFPEGTRDASKRLKNGLGTGKGALQTETEPRQVVELGSISGERNITD